MKYIGTAPLTGVHAGRLAVEQLYGYMVRNAKTFGILTTLRGWSFAFRQNQGQLFLTPVFASNPISPAPQVPGQPIAPALLPYQQPTVTTMMAIYYISHLSANTADTYEIAPPGQVGDLDLPWAEPDGSSAAPRAGVATPPLLPTIQPAPPHQYDQYGQHGHDFNVRFCPSVKENQLGGKSWKVDIDPANTQGVLKLWSDDDESQKINEATIYKRLERLWGRCVPSLLAVDFWQHSNSILVEYIKVRSSYPTFIYV